MYLLFKNGGVPASYVSLLEGIRFFFMSKLSGSDVTNVESLKRLKTAVLMATRNLVNSPVEGTLVEILIIYNGFGCTIPGGCNHQP